MKFIQREWTKRSSDLKQNKFSPHASSLKMEEEYSSETSITIILTT
jgi:hypothetical protein